MMGKKVKWIGIAVACVVLTIGFIEVRKAVTTYSDTQSEAVEASRDMEKSFSTLTDSAEGIPLIKKTRASDPVPLTGPSIFILKNTAYLGMSTATVRERCGPPNDINRTVGSWGVHEQWVYGSTIYWRVYLYFENGYLTSWQE